MGKYQNYDDYAKEYAHTRQVFQWVLDPLIKEVKGLSDNSTIIEVGCGTGNYITSLAKELPSFDYKAFDISEKMLCFTKARSNLIEFSKGNADESFPYPDNSADLSFAVDVIHHITKPDNFFKEVNRTLKLNGSFLLVTDLEENIRKRSLSKYFPEILEIELNRYLGKDELYDIARDSNLHIIESYKAEGFVDLSNDFISKLERKCSSAMRLIPDEKHKEGMKRLREGQKRGEKWFSCYTVLKYSKVI
jgi:ubiquinone/menaquinone biosynthesis C-methylase UbiE